MSLNPATLLACALVLSTLAACSREQSSTQSRAPNDTPTPLAAATAPPPGLRADEGPLAGWPSPEEERTKVQALMQQIGSSQEGARERREELQRRLDQIDQY